MKNSHLIPRVSVPKTPKFLGDVGSSQAESLGERTSVTQEKYRFRVACDRIQNLILEILEIVRRSMNFSIMITKHFQW